MSGWLYLLSLLCFMIPTGFFFYIAVETGLRNRTALNRLYSGLFYTIMVFFLADALINLIPAEFAPAVTIWMKLVPALLMMSFSIHLIMRMTDRFDHWSRARIVLFGYSPAFCALFLIMPSSYVYVDVTQRGPWTDVMPSPAAFNAVMVSAVYTFGACLYFLYQGMTYVKRSGLTQKRKQLRLLLLAYLYGGISGIGLVSFNPYFMTSESFNMPEPSTLGLILFAFMIRYGMVRYELLPTIERKYKVLYDRSPIAIVLLNRYGRIIEANSAALTLFGLREADFLHQKFERLAPPYEQGSLAGDRDKENFRITSVSGSKPRILQTEHERIESGGEPFEYVLIRDITDHIKAEERIIYMAYNDPLTGLGNRRKFQEALSDLLAMGEQDGETVSLIQLDLDYFKDLNDARGHHVGDLLLQHVGCVLSRSAASARLISRLGGDEFALLFKGTQREIAEETCVAIFKGLKEPFVYMQESFTVSASIGICLSRPYASSPEQLLQYADLALNEAKRHGRGQYRMFTEELKHRQENRLILGQEIKGALRENRFRLYFQPQIDLATGGIWGVEALVRWIQPDGSVLPPSVFIPYAEESGLIVPLGRRVLEKACRIGSSWLQAGRDELAISVNVSNKELAAGDYVEDLKAILAETGYPPRLLQLEVTESTHMVQREQQLRQFRELADMGIQLAMDDFGTGYSTFSVIQSLPFQVFKIDKSMIDGIDGNSNARNIVQAMIVMAHSLNQQVVAEGVETAGQAEVLRALDCDAVQGYFFSRPLPLDMLLDWMDSREKGTA
ncbi:EAL domain-containing protein [Paenibacillus sp. HN-1]|uniref:putative bifunctional diguanylate cyclase/phosphodiesterase n=1 Tax=Paenibacillus TaxID=44249 RepID=UPI001CA8B3B2|nr:MULTISPECIES: EAL domain-containing protein [Paenibacillus]MBY9077801.1 EAL domain-containing protein [Paenibacillus sp. CGMCC 1.18879]MBY9088243.1 EAL domain-containing protein [Paenibacillus sinensis]